MSPRLVTTARAETATGTSPDVALAAVVARIEARRLGLEES